MNELLALSVVINAALVIAVLLYRSECRTWRRVAKFLQSTADSYRSAANDYRAALIDTRETAGLNDSPCWHCQGSGSQDDGNTDCPDCGGTGYEL